MESPCPLEGEKKGGRGGGGGGHFLSPPRQAPPGPRALRPKGWSYLSLPLLTWQRLDASTALVEWHDSEAFASAEYLPDPASSATFERVGELFDAVLMDDSFAAEGIEVIVDTSGMSYTFATLHLAPWVRGVWQRPGWERVRRCHLVVTGAVMPTLVSLAVDDHPRLRCHESLEAACGACGVDPELVV